MTAISRLAAVLSLSAAAGAANAGALTVQLSDQAGKPLADAVVYAEPDAGLAVPKLLKQGEIEQRGLKFLPLVSVIQTGSRIAFPNNDKVKHHIYSFSPAKKFDQKLYSGAAANIQVFDKAGTVVLGCNIHDKMIAYVKVVDTPYFGKSDAGGVVHIDIPTPGKYTLRAWHFHMKGDAPLEQAIVVKGAEAQAAVFKIALKPPVAEAESGDAGY